MPSVRRGDLLDPVVSPEPVDATECRNAALGAYSRSTKNENTISGRDGEHWRILYWRADSPQPDLGAMDTAVANSAGPPRPTAEAVRPH